MKKEKKIKNIMKKRSLLPSAGLSLLLLSVFFLGACSSLPFPGSPAESLFVIASSIDREYDGGEKKVSKVILTLERLPEENTEEAAGGSEDGSGDESAGRTEEFLVTLKHGEPYGTAALEPGEYIITKINVHSFLTEEPGQNWIDEHIVYYPFFIEKRTVRLYEQVFLLEAEPPDGEGYTLAFAPLSSEEKKLDIFKALRSDGRWPGWERYILVGFPEEASEITE